MSPHPRPLKVLHVISGDLWAGAEVQAFNLLTALQRLEGIEVAAALLNEGELARRLRECGIAVTVVDETRLNALQILLSLVKLMRTWRPDVVHTHRTKENVLGALANRLTRSVPCLRTAHGAPEHAPRGFSQLHKKAFQRIDQWSGRHLQKAVIAVTAELAVKLQPRLPAGKTVVIENGVDVGAMTQALQPAHFDNGPADVIHVGLVGRLVAVKRVDLFLEAADLLRREAPQRHWHFHVFGDGPLRGDLMQQARRSGIDASTTFHGHRADIAACIAGLDVLVMCSDHEGLPMTLLEAMSLGVAVVGHNVGGIAQLLEDGRCGWPVNEHTALGYTQAVLAATAATDRAARIQSAKTNVLARYSSATCAQQHLKLYRKLAAA